MVFELGKVYQHTTGIQIKIVGEASTTLYGECLVSEDYYGTLKPVGTDTSNAENWFEITEDEWMKNFSN